MASTSSTDTLTCKVCAATFKSGEKLLITPDNELVHSTCWSCCDCKQFFALDSLISSIDGYCYHAECIHCYGCKKDIRLKCVLEVPSLFVSRPANRDNGDIVLWHTNCYGCECDKCNNERIAGTFKPRGGVEDFDYSYFDKSSTLFKTRHHNRIFDEKILNPRHRKCVKCKQEVGLKCSDGRNTQELCEHWQCAKCKDCIQDEDRHLCNGNERIHYKCIECPECDDGRRVICKDNGKRKGGWNVRDFIVNDEGVIVHTDCVDCVLCGMREKGRYAELRGFRGVLSYEENKLHNAQPHVLGEEAIVHMTCPQKSSGKRKFADFSEAFEAAKKRAKK